MLIAYLTTDEVNLDMAGRMAEDVNSILYPLSFGEAPPANQFDAVVYDLDYLPASHRQEVLEDLQSSPLSCPVLVHSYHLERDQENALRLNGVSVYRRLEPDMFRLLGRQPASNRTRAGHRQTVVVGPHLFGANQRATA